MTLTLSLPPPPSSCVTGCGHGVKSMSADMFLDLPTMSAPSGEERKLGAAAQVERAGLCLRRFRVYTVRAPLKLRRLNPQG
jgi:hypothetical protein